MKVQYGTSTARLHQLTLKFDGYKKRQNHTMRQHLTVISNMISELRTTGHEMTDEQQIQAVIRSLPSNWEPMLINLTHNNNIKIFDDVTRHVELEEDRLLVEKPVQEAFISENKSRGVQGSRHNKGKEEANPVIVDKSISARNTLVREASTRIALIIVNWSLCS